MAHSYALFTIVSSAIDSAHSKSQKIIIYIIWKIRCQHCICKELYYIFGRCYSLSGIIHMKDKSVPYITKGSSQCEKSRETSKNMKRYLKHQCVCVCMCVKSLQSCLTICGPIVCSLPSSSVHGIPQARILEWIAMPFCRSSQPRDWICVSYIFLHWQMGCLPVGPPGKPLKHQMDI